MSGAGGGDGQGPVGAYGFTMGLRATLRERGEERLRARARSYT